MKYRLCFALFFVTGLIACNKGEEDICHPEFSIQHWYEYKKIEIEADSIYPVVWYTIEPGNKLLFDYLYHAPQCDNIHDDEWWEALHFTIDPGITSFEFVDEEIVEANCINSSGAWVRSPGFPVTEGTIKGEKLWNNEWIISVDVTVPLLLNQGIPHRITFTKRYSKR